MYIIRMFEKRRKSNFKHEVKYKSTTVIIIIIYTFFYVQNISLFYTVKIKNGSPTQNLIYKLNLSLDEESYVKNCYKKYF